MKFRSLIFLSLYFPFLVQAAPYAYPFNAMTGEQVLGKLLKEPSAEIDYIERDMAHHYVNGVKDATQGTAWCFVGAVLPHELNIELAFAIKSTRTSGELKGNAAPLLLDELRKRYPCKSTRGGKS